MSNPLKNPPKDGWTKDDHTRRCITTNCGAGRDACGAWVGTPLSMVYVSAYQEGAPNIVVARAAVCMRCCRLYGLTLRLDPETHKQVADGLGTNRTLIEACLRASKNATLFTLAELQAGVMESVVLSDNVQEMMAKRSHGAGMRDAQEARSGIYNPNAFLEPEQEVLPL